MLQKSGSFLCKYVQFKVEWPEMIKTACETIDTLKSGETKSLRHLKRKHQTTLNWVEHIQAWDVELGKIRWINMDKVNKINRNISLGGEEKLRRKETSLSRSENHKTANVLTSLGTMIVCKTHSISQICLRAGWKLGQSATSIGFRKCGCRMIAPATFT